MLLRNLYRIRPCYTVVDGHMDRMTNERSEEFIIEMMRMKKKNNLKRKEIITDRQSGSPPRPCSEGSGGSCGRAARTGVRAAAAGSPAAAAAAVAAACPVRQLLYNV